MIAPQKLKYIIEENNGFLKTSDAIAAGVSKSSLGDFVHKHELERVAHGLYMSKDAWYDELFILQTRYPKSVFSHETALFLLNLAHREPATYSLTLKTGTSSSALSKQGIKVYKIKEALFGEGVIDVRSLSGNIVRSYNAERTICDLFRSRRNIEIQVLQEAVKTYILQKEKNIPLLMRYAKIFSVEKNVRQYLEVLL